MKTFRFLGSILGRRDWVYLLSLLVPFVVYSLSLKATDVVSMSGGEGVWRTLSLMQSDVFFGLGYAMFWVGLFAVARIGVSRWVVVVLFHAVTILMVVAGTVARQYFRETGTTLDYSMVAEWIPKVEELMPIFLYDISPWAWGLLAAAFFYATLGPLVITLLVEWWAGAAGRFPSGVALRPLWGSLGLWGLALGFVFLSLLTGTTTLSRDPVLNLVLTGVEEATTDEDPGAPAVAENPALNATLAPTPQIEKRNVVLVHLESTRAQSVTPYNQDLETTPFLDELSKESLFVERAYTTVPRSSKASVSVNCGVEPPLYPGPEFEPDGIPAQCLAGLLRERGYKTVFFASTNAALDNFGAVVEGFGYEEFYPVETMDTTGYQVTNTFGYEDDVMLGPSEDWLKERGDEPFMAEYFTGTGHYPYQCYGTRHGSKDFPGEGELDAYHNCLRLQDIFLESLFEQYKELGLYEETVFVIFGDHGEGFGEHDRSMHGDTPYEEGIKVPLIIHAPGQFDEGQRVEGLASQMDILPTVVDMLGYEVENGEYPGYSLLARIPEDRTLMFSCISNRKCLASIQGYEKYIYHYNNQPDEFFDLSEDPLERKNIVNMRNKAELDRLRGALIEWRSEVNAEYSGSTSQPY
ncbi:hypothetical protein BH24ACT19_BH24ACT19_07210 [soil metagenome]